MSTPGSVLSDLSIGIVGGGLIGLSAAWRLRQAGFRISLFEKGSLGREASWAGAGMLSPGGEVERESPLATLAIESRRLYPSFVRELERESGLEQRAVQIVHAAPRRVAVEALNLCGPFPGVILKPEAE